MGKIGNNLCEVLRMVLLGKVNASEIEKIYDSEPEVLGFGPEEIEIFLSKKQYFFKELAKEKIEMEEGNYIAENTDVNSIIEEFEEKTKVFLEKLWREGKIVQSGCWVKTIRDFSKGSVPLITTEFVSVFPEEMCYDENGVYYSDIIGEPIETEWGTAVYVASDIGLDADDSRERLFDSEIELIADQLLKGCFKEREFFIKKLFPQYAQQISMACEVINKNVEKNSEGPFFDWKDKINITLDEVMNILEGKVHTAQKIGEELSQVPGIGENIQETLEAITDDREKSGPDKG